MIRTIITATTIALLLMSSRSEGEGLRLATIDAAAVSPTNSAYGTNLLRAVTGKTLALSIKSVGGNATCTVFTVSGTGSSYGKSKTILPAIVVGPLGYTTNFALSEFLYADNIAWRFDNASITSSVTPSGVLIYGDE